MSGKETETHAQDPVSHLPAFSQALIAASVFAKRPSTPIGTQDGVRKHDINTLRSIRRYEVLLDISCEHLLQEQQHVLPAACFLQRTDGSVEHDDVRLNVE